jgi:hypothetical protein
MSRISCVPMFLALAVFALCGTYSGRALADPCSSANYDGNLLGKFKSHTCYQGTCQQDNGQCSSSGSATCMIEQCSACGSYKGGSGYQCPVSNASVCQQNIPAICMNLGDC